MLYNIIFIICPRPLAVQKWSIYLSKIPKSSNFSKSESTTKKEGVNLRKNLLPSFGLIDKRMNIYDLEQPHHTSKNSVYQVD